MPADAAYIIVFDGSNRAVLVRNSNTKGKWALPGAQISMLPNLPGMWEDAHASAKREFAKVTGLRLAKSDFTFQLTFQMATNAQFAQMEANYRNNNGIIP